MSVNETILTALAPLGFPVKPDRYTGEEPVYLTFHVSRIGAMYANDAPRFDRCLVAVHLFAPYGWNSIETRREIRKRLFAAGFTWPEETPAEMGNEENTNEGQHIVFECEIEEAISFN
jgi:hypothetical protein